MGVRPAAGPLTISDEPDSAPTTRPPTTPATTPEISGAPEATAIPRQSGKATRNTTMPAGTSSRQVSKNELVEMVRTSARRRRPALPLVQP